MFLYFSDKASVVELLVEAARLYRPGMVDYLAVRFAKQVALSIPRLPSFDNDSMRRIELARFQKAVLSTLQERLSVEDLEVGIRHEDALEVAEGVLQRWFKLSPRAVAEENVLSRRSLLPSVYGSVGVLAGLPSELVGYERTIHISCKDDFLELMSPFCATSRGAALIDPYAVSRRAAGISLFLESVFAADSQIANASVLGVVTIDSASDLLRASVGATAAGVERQGCSEIHLGIETCIKRLKKALVTAVKNVLTAVSACERGHGVIVVQLVVGPVFGFHDRFTYFSTREGTPLQAMGSRELVQMNGGVSLALSTSLNAISSFGSDGFSIVAPVTNAAMSDQLRLIHSRLLDRAPLLLEVADDRCFLGHGTAVREFPLTAASEQQRWLDVIESAVNEFSELLRPQ